MREARRSVDVAGAQLPQHGQQGVAHQRVDLVDQQHQRSRVGHAPTQQRVPQCLTRPHSLQHSGPEVLQRVVAQGHACLQRQFGEHGAHALRHVLAHRLAILDVRVHAPVVAGMSTVQQVAQREQRRGLAGLPRRVQHEVLLVLHEAEHVVQIDPV